MEAAPLILVIDDSVVTQKILETCLRRAGYQVVCFADPVLTLRALLLTKEQAVPDLVFVDVVLPRLSGYDVVKRLRNHAEYRHLPIIMISGYTGILDRLKGRLAGATTYITKPLTHQGVLAVIQQLLTAGQSKETRGKQ